MPKATCQLNLTLDVPTAEWVERIANDIHVRPSGCGRVLVEQRLSLERAGWKCDDKNLGVILEAVVSLDEKGKVELVKFLKQSGAVPGEITGAPIVDPYQHSYFRTGVLRSKAV